MQRRIGYVILAVALLSGLLLTAAGCMSRDPATTVTIRIEGVSNSADQDAVKEILKGLTDGSSHSMSNTSSGDSMTVTLSPVSDFDAFTKKIPFGQILAMDADRRHVTVLYKKNPAPMPALFTYGTLMLGEVMETLTGQTFASEPAVLDDFGRFGVLNAVFPGIIPLPGETTPGILYHDVNSATLQLLDWFEGALYQRQPVSVRGQSDARMSAEAYVVTAAHRDRLSSLGWDLDSFRAKHAGPWLDRCARLRQEYRQGFSD